MDSANKIICSQYIHYIYQKGKPGSKNLLFLHGWGTSSATWTPLMTKMANLGLNCFAPDLPGFGSSENPKMPFNVSNYAEIISVFQEQIIKSKTTLVCHSFGGRVGIKTIGLNDTLIEKLILIDSAGIVEKSIKQKFFETLSTFIHPKIKSQTENSFKKTIYKILGSDYLVMPELKDTFKKIVNEDQTKELDKISTPTLILWGEKDKDTPLSMGKKIHSYIKNSKLITYESAGHFSYLDEHEKVFNDIKDFIL